MTTSHGSRNRPYKVWSCDRQTRKAVVASSLRELKEKGCDKLGYSQQLQEGHCMRLVLESDGTDVEEDSYFQTVAADTIFLLLRPSEKWLPPGVEALRAGSDTLDAAGISGNDLGQILNSLRKDIANLLILNEDQLRLVAEMEPSEQAQSSGDRQVLSLFKEASDRMLIDRENFQEAQNVLQLLKNSSALGTAKDAPDGSLDRRLASVEYKERNLLKAEVDEARHPLNVQIKRTFDDARHCLHMQEEQPSKKSKSPAPLRVSRRVKFPKTK